MASQPSTVQNEERNRLRLQAWEQRNQDISQSNEFSPENFPVFGEPYKVYKGDELSNRIRRMLGSYEDVNSPSPFSVEGLPIPAYVTFSQSDQPPPNSDNSTKLPFHGQILPSSTENQTGPSTTAFSSSTSSSPKHVGQSPTNCTPSLNNSQSREPLKKSEIPPDLTEMSSPSPNAKPPPPSHSSDHKTTDADTEEQFDGQQLQRSKDLPAESVGTVAVSTQNIKQSAKDVAVSQTSKTGTLPSQTFPPLLSSKQPCAVMTQKPTAYVRPMDGQDQVVSESPELKPSPEPYVPVAEIIDKSELSKADTKPQPVETRADEAQCVEDILREMTHSWPPLLTALHTPNTQEPSKFLFPVKEAERVSSRPGQKNRDSSVSSKLKQQPFLNSSSEAAHSSGRETASSSDSDSSSGSESESENTTEELLQPSNKSLPDAGPALSNGDWQLGNWIRSSQQSSSAEGHGSAHVSESAAHKQLPLTQSSKHAGVEAIGPAGTSRPHRAEFIAGVSTPQQRGGETPQEKHCRHSRQKAASADVKGRSSSRKPSKTTKAGCPDGIVKSEAAANAQTKDSCFTDKPKVKTKAGRGEKTRDKAATKTDLKRTKKVSLSGPKAAAKAEAPLVQPAHCPSCGVPHPNRCSCSAQSPAQPRPLSLAPPGRAAHSRSKAQTPVCPKSGRRPHITTHKHLKTPGHTASDAPDPSRPPLSLLVKIDLSLLSRVPQTPTSTRRGIPSTVKTAAAVRGRAGGGGDVSAKHKRTKTSNKHKMPNVDGEDSSIPRKKQKLENNNTSLLVFRKPEVSKKPAEALGKKKAKKTTQQPATIQNKAQDSKLHKSSSGKILESSGATVRSRESSKQRKNSDKHKEQPQGQKQKPLKRSVAPASPSQPIGHALTNRPLLRSGDRQYPVKHYIKEAKRLKHKADAEADKLSKAFNYLDAAMFFVESGIAMEKDPQISMSSYTMFAETVELLKFVLKLKNSVDSAASPSEKDFLALCLKCQSLLQMALFRHKHKTALKYSKTLTDHFNTSAQATHNPPKVVDQSSPATPSPAATPTGPAGTATVVVPHAIEQVAFSYVNITTLVLSAYELWEQAEELAQGGSGLLSELDTVLGPLSLSAGMSSVVRYTRQGVHWLRLDSHKV